MAKKKRKKPGLPPGTLVYTGRKQAAGVNVILLQYNAEVITEVFARDEAPPMRTGNLVSWYDVRGLTNVALIESLGRTFNIHPLALEDILNTQQRPKLEEFPEAAFLILEAMTWDAASMEVRSEQVALFTTREQVISFQEDADDLFPAVRERLTTAHGRLRQRGPDYLTYALADYIIDNYYIVLDQIEEAIQQLEQEILDLPQKGTKSRIHKLRLAVLRMRKASGPTREAIGRLHKLTHPVFREETAIFVRDLYDHIIQINDSIDTYRDMINGLYDLYLSEISFKTNSVIQVLTIISTVFIPLTFLVGVYGMNFDYMPELRWRYGYFAIWGLMVLIFVGMLFYFRRRKWI